MEILSHFDNLKEFKVAYDDLGYSEREGKREGLSLGEKKRIGFVKRMQKKELVFPEGFPSEEGLFLLLLLLFL